VLLYYFDGVDDLLSQAIPRQRDRFISKGLAAASQGPGGPPPADHLDPVPADSGLAERTAMSEIALSAGTIEYEDTGGNGPTIVLLHGIMMDASLWDGPIADCPSITDAWHRRFRWARTGARCTPTPTCPFPGSAGW